MQSIHMSEKDMIDFFQQQVSLDMLPHFNFHLLNCSQCAERLSALILFAIENEITASIEEKEYKDSLKTDRAEIMIKNIVEKIVVGIRK